ncbi:hypothetical protein N7517_002813 [Penicillium concentricum]|uniref:Uncharacterized protein n=1 Tax=Penicillium concentricum TaxID=293559 RepID=A0A9W9SUI8_9EURO|nr:uncharacterized protein N7517_002813 [Penicillium concentricum]KAJ5384902.1 hypothetical protein N7517_002813 [Penicillium concentricum]
MEVVLARIQRQLGSGNTKLAASKPTSPAFYDSNGGHQDEENPQGTRTASHTNNGDHIDEEISHEPESQPAIIKMKKSPMIL